MSKPTPTRVTTATPPPSSTRKLDRWAIFLSGACLVHCIAISATVFLIPTIATVLISSETATHWAFLLIAIPLSAVALGSGFRQHRSWQRLGIGSAGLILMFVGVSHLAGRELELPLTVVGVALVTIAHLLNIRQAFAPSETSGS